MLSKNVHHTFQIMYVVGEKNLIIFVNLFSRHCTFLNRPNMGSGEASERVEERNGCIYLC